jgi:hypothetical protein
MKTTSKIALFTIFIAITTVASKLTFSCVLGSYAMKFSGINFLVPLLGAFFGITTAGLALATIFALKFFFTTLCVTLGIPTALATLSWIVNTHNTKRFAQIAHITDFLLHVLFPITCIILFIMHPTGGQAYAYSFYWFIPVTLFFVQYISEKNIFLMAMQSTFIAHATGSIMVLYTTNLTATQWLSLIPIVAIERLVMASGMTLSMLAITKIYARVQKSRLFAQAIRITKHVK